MWVLPKNYHPSSAFVADTVESKEELSLLESSIESSLMWRSKPSPLRTWLLRWNRVNWIQLLFGRILKPSQHTYFEEQLTLSLAGILASRSQQQDSEKEKMIPDTCGQQSESTLKPSDQIDAFSRTSKDTYRLDSPASSATWKKMVTEQRGEYSQRVKLAHHTKESESISWPTPTARDWKDTPGMAKTAVNKDGSKRSRTDQLARAVYSRENTTNGNLNPEFSEWLMGVPIGWTELNF